MEDLQRQGDVSYGIGQVGYTHNLTQKKRGLFLIGLPAEHKKGSVALVATELTPSP